MATVCLTVAAQQPNTGKDSAQSTVTAADTLAAVPDTTDIVDELLSEGDSLSAAGMIGEEMESLGFHQQLKQKFIEGNAEFMSLVALALVLGLAFCIERLIYLTLAEVNAHKMLKDIDSLVMNGDVEGAKTLCRDTRGPVASVCYQGLLHIDESLDDIQRSIVNYGSVQVANLEKGCSLIKLFIAIAPSLGFLGTVIGMVMSFDHIQQAGDIGPTIVAEGMKVALITTIFGIVVALILQVFYNYILVKIEQLSRQMEESAITLLETIKNYKGKVKE
jgi:biopolymer transport protein ExbB